MQQQEEVGKQNGGTLQNKKLQHNPNFVPRQLLPREQVLLSFLKGLNNGSTDNVGSLLNQEVCGLHEEL
jgi:hypothetical protein